MTEKFEQIIASMMEAETFAKESSKTERLMRLHREAIEKAEIVAAFWGGCSVPGAGLPEDLKRIEAQGKAASQMLELLLLHFLHEPYPERLKQYAPMSGPRKT